VVPAGLHIARDLRQQHLALAHKAAQAGVDERRLALRAALLGNPNCGKTALFNLLTGARQKVANYAGVTVERKEGWLSTPGKRRVRAVPAREST